MILGLPGGNLLIDTSPDVREQLLREQIGIVHAVLYTHEHADHVFGLDDLRLMQFYLGGPVPLYCEAKVEERIRKSFDYAFATAADLHPGAVPQLVFRRIATGAVRGAGRAGRADPPEARPRFDVLGFRFGNVAYCTDANAIPPESMELLRGLDVLVLDALRPRGHATHFSLEEAVEVAAATCAAADVLHAHVARAGARGDERGAAAGHGAGVRRAADSADVMAESRTVGAATAESQVPVVLRTDARSGRFTAALPACGWRWPWAAAWRRRSCCRPTGRR